MNNLLLIPVIKPEKNKLEEAYEIAGDVAVDFQGARLMVPKFFQFDGASVPSAFWGAIGTPFSPRFMRASVFHDWLSYTHQLTRDDTNELFYRMLVADKVNKIKATIMKQAVVVSSEWYWNNDKDDDAYLAALAKRIEADGRVPKDYGL